MTSSRRRINSLIHDRSRSTSPSATRCIATFSKAAPPVVAELGESERKRGGTRLRERPDARTPSATVVAEATAREVGVIDVREALELTALIAARDWQRS